jgi:nitrogen fixation/metabolism regulation signal transduction histidine kinase
MKTLVDGFNAMVENLKKHQREIAELSKKAAWAEMAQKVAHEIKNPLTPIQLSAEHILRVYEDNKGGFDKALRESASYIISEVENLRRIAQEFLELSRETALKKERFDLRDLIREVAAPYQKMLSERVRLREVYEGSDFRLEADRSKIKIALRNIVINAIEAIRGRGEIEIRASRGQDSVRLEIRDTGAGIPNEVLKKIFDPYFSTKDVGTGLGLPIAKKIVEDHGGSIRAESEVGKGTAIFITLPAGPAAGDPGGGAEDEGGAP